MTNKPSSSISKVITTTRSTVAFVFPRLCCALRRSEKYVSRSRIANELMGFFRNETNLRGLNLPVDVLNHIYYWNAARLVPEVRQSLEQCGRKLS